MKLVLIYNIDGGYECGSYDEILPIEYESAEALICDFEKELDTAYKKDKRCGAFLFGTEHFWTDNFYDQDGVKTLPDILTLEEWFGKFNIYP
jgi:hypothetical protein